jgi:hypothetical protein
VAVDLTTPEYRTSSSWALGSFKTFEFRTAHLGPDAAPGELRERIHSVSQNTSTGAEYDLAYEAAGTRYADGFVRSPALGDLAHISTRLGSPDPNKRGYLWVRADTGTGPSGVAAAVPRSLPYEGTVFVNTDGGTKWQLDLQQYDLATGLPDAEFATPYTAYEAGRKYQRNFNVGVFGPSLGAGQGVSRTGDSITGSLSLFTDSDGNTGPWTYARATARTTLTRNGTEVAANDDPLSGTQSFKVPSGPATYRLSTTVSRAAGVSVSGSLSVSWTFRSRHVAETTALPVSVVRFAVPLAADTTAAAGSMLRIPVSVQGAAAGRHLAALLVYVSYDEGAHWSLRPVVGGKVGVRTPAAGKSVSLRAKVIDTDGDTADQTILRAYLAK